MASSGKLDFGAALGAMAVVSGLAIAALPLFGAPIYISLLVVLFLGLSFLALLLQADEKGRDDIARALGDDKYTQFYCYVSKRVIDYIWPKVSPENIADDAGLIATFRAALTWWLYDKALLFAAAYPILLLVGFWIFGFPAQDGKLGSITVLEATAFWPERVAILATIALVSLSSMLEKWAAASPIVFLRKVSGWLIPTAVAGTFIVALALAGAFTGVVAVAVAVALVSAFTSAAAGAVVVIFALSGAFISAGAVSISASTSVALTVALLLTIAGALVIVFVVEYLDRRGKAPQARWLVSVTVPIGWIILLQHLNWGDVRPEARAIFVFLGVFPLINAVFDFVSYAITLTLLRIGLRARWPFLYGVLDLIAAMVLFLALGAALTVILAGMNWLAGVALVDLGAVFAGAREAPGENLWVYFMLFSTILPTVLHFAISLLGAQGFMFRWVRHRVAGWVTDAPARPVIVALTPFAVGAIWTIPFVFVFGVGWVVWVWGGDFLRTLGGLYFDGLLGLAHWIGAF